MTAPTLHDLPDWGFGKPSNAPKVLIPPGPLAALVFKLQILHKPLGNVCHECMTLAPCATWLLTEEVSA